MAKLLAWVFFVFATLLIGSCDTDENKNTGTTTSVCVTFLDSYCAKIFKCGWASKTECLDFHEDWHFCQSDFSKTTKEEIDQCSMALNIMDCDTLDEDGLPDVCVNALKPEPQECDPSNFSDTCSGNKLYSCWWTYRIAYIDCVAVCNDSGMKYKECGEDDYGDYGCICY